MRRSVRNSSRQRPLRLSRSRVESQLRVEPLEGRIVMTAGITFDARQGLIRMNGTERNDVASIAIDGRGSSPA
jgi:hypothetical protein